MLASKEAADAVSSHLPLDKLIECLESNSKIRENDRKAQAVVYWMRMGDLRSEVDDNRALFYASEHAQQQGLPLLVVFIFSPQDYLAHDRSPRRIDFTIRNLHSIKSSLSNINIPLYTITHSPRKTLPSRLVSILGDFGSNSLFANYEYEIDELGRDIAVCRLAERNGIKFRLFHDRCVVPPGVIKSKQEKSYVVYSPYLKAWASAINQSSLKYLEQSPPPSPNSSSVPSSPVFGPLFKQALPDALGEFKLEDENGEKAQMCEMWPAGEQAAKDLLDRFLYTKSCTSQMGPVHPLASDAEESKESSRAWAYGKDRDRADRDTTSRLSPYFSAGVISARECVRSAMRLLGISENKVDVTRMGTGNGVSKWVQEIAWRDFYTNVLVAHPRVCMGRPFNEKYATVVWEEAGPNFQKWKDGKTGYPIVDAGMRCVRVMGWVHNRVRMICAMFLCKHLMIDWREGERYFMQVLIDGDLASNNGGWQWSASTGTDAVPYFRIFNPYSQSVKVDPHGEFIRYWVPELATIKGEDIHHPPEKLAEKLGYPRPIVEHKEARERALRRYKNPGNA